MLKKTSFLISIIFLLNPLTIYAENLEKSNVTTFDKVTWGYLNPLRGVKSPGAADLWGDRTKNEATGMLVRFKKGFSSPPHIHNITYRGVVIEGLMHNDDPNADEMWLPTGSFWTQPAGESHITEAQGTNNLIYLEIDSGPYLVEPSEKHFDNGERPLNVHASNIIWLDELALEFVQGKGINVAYLWEDDLQDSKVTGYLIKFNPETMAKISTDATEFRSVVIDGIIEYESAEIEGSESMQPGSYFSSIGDFEHIISTNEESIIYVRANKEIKINSIIFD
ncbi:DUF4437 domain-containing protein [Gilvimarinus chinensis]|uniref:DUF4437 domain-containing protein n=1 Tax=Gilvimarinus chinensis TaxID=396005 RepID=UPI0003747B2B|nr:DUF4437 domain-containing protein [Gilvimarinus chinensis]